jgi:hypothetical protein
MNSLESQQSNFEEQQNKVEADLRNLIREHFDEDELQELCDAVGIKYRDLRGETRTAKARELVAMCRRRILIPELTAACRKQRPRINWPNWPTQPTALDFSALLQAPWVNTLPTVESSQPIAPSDIINVSTSDPISNTPQAAEISYPTAEPGSSSFFDKLFLYLVLIAVGFIAASVVFNVTKSNHILDTFIVHEFEVESNSIPQQVTPINNPYTLSALITDAFHVEGEHSLALSVALPPFNGVDQYSGLSIDLPEHPKVDAISAYLYIPLTSTLSTKIFQVEFVAKDELGRDYHSGLSTVKVGEWVPLFWGTRYYASEPNLCRDDNLDNQCDTPTGSWSQSWQDTYIVGFDIRVVRNGEPYQGLIYFDKIEVYQLSSLPEATITPSRGLMPTTATP